MAITVEKLERTFTYNGLSLPDPNPTFTPQQVRDTYSAAYPELTTAEIEGPVTKGNKLEFTFRRAVGTKG
jgi:PRTRC genetic system protein C